MSEQAFADKLAAADAWVSTVDYIGYHARQRPDAVAVIENGRDIRYDALFADIARMTPMLRNLGLGAGDTVAIELPSFYVHWLIALSCEALGVATFSYSADEADIVSEFVADMDLVLHAADGAPRNARRAHRITREWVAAIPRQTPELPLRTVALCAASPVRIVKSSGTTGSAKTMIHTARVHDHWIRQFQFRTGFSSQSRFLLTSGFGVQAYHAHVTACIRMGGVCVFDQRRGTAEAMAAYAITHTTLMPMALLALLDGLPRDFRKPDSLTIVTIGAPVTETVRRRVRERLAEVLLEAYGTNEICAICTMDGDGEGTVLPGVQVQTVNDAGQPVSGEAGLIRVTSPGLVAGYLNNADASRAMFRDGWFYPGDVGILTQPNRLKLLGRADDLINVQGVKFSPRGLEEELLATLPVEDLCLAALNDASGAPQFWVAVVLPQPGDLSALGERLTNLLPPALKSAQAIAVSEIPRTAMGKIQRGKLNDAVRRKLEGREAGET